MDNTNEKLFDFIKKSPSAFHAVGTAARALEDAGAVRLFEGGKWKLERGKKYFTVKNGSSLIAFYVPDSHPKSYMISAAHSDSPSFKIKPGAAIKDKNFVRFSTEKYGGMLCATWFDRPLSVAGRIVVETEDGIESRLVDLKRPVAVIPSVAIHMNRNANENASYNPAVDMLPLVCQGEKFSLIGEIAKCAGVSKEDVLSHDLFLYVPEEGKTVNNLICAPRLDDLECVFASLEAFSGCESEKSVPVMCVFDNEEVGSATKQGAASTFLSDTLERISLALGYDAEDHKRLLSCSMMLSCDNAHSIHPNHPEYSDPGNCPVLNGGVVIKYNANQKYTTDAISGALFKVICERAEVPVQRFANRSDIPGGSTLGSIADTKVSVNTVDIGLAQLAMHSCFETAGAEDAEHLVRALSAFYASYIEHGADGKYSVI